MASAVSIPSPIDEQPIVVPVRRKELDARGQPRGVRARRQGEAAHPKQVAEKRIVDGAEIGAAEEFVVAFELVDGRRGHGGGGQHQAGLP